MEAFNQPRSCLMGLEALCDGAIRTADGGLFEMHCAIVACKSDFFRATIKGDFNGGNVQRDIFVTNVRGEIMHSILIYIYTEDPKVITPEHIGELLAASDFLSIPCLLQKCRDSVSSLISPANCFELLNVSYFLSHLDLYEACHRYAQTRFSLAVSQLQQSSESLADLQELDPTPFLRLLTSDLNVDDEEPVWIAITTWISKDPSTRRVCVPQLLQCLRIEDMSEDLLRNVASQSCRELLTQNFAGMTLKASVLHVVRALHPHERLDARVPSNRLVCITGNSSAQLHLSFDGRCDGGTWCKVGQKSGFHPTTAVAICGTVYLFNASQDNPGCCFDLLEKTWYNLPPMNEPRTGYKVLELHDTVYCIGSSLGTSTTVERYKRATNRWTTLSAIPMSRIVAVAALGGRLYALGLIISAGSRTVAARVYSPFTFSWSPFRRPAFDRIMEAEMVAFDGRLYVVGGTRDLEFLKKVERYDAETDNWESITDLPQYLFYPGAAVFSSTLILFGRHYPDTHPIYRQKRDGEWKEWKVDFDVSGNIICEIIDRDTNLELRPMLKYVDWSPSLPTV